MMDWPGELREEPLDFTVASECLSQVCSHCLRRPPTSSTVAPVGGKSGTGKTKKLRRCAGCQRLYFCNARCQKLAWPVHQFECPMLKESGVESGDIRLTIRLILRHIRDEFPPIAKEQEVQPKINESECESGCRRLHQDWFYRRTFADLMDHAVEMYRGGSRADVIEEFTKMLKVLSGNPKIRTHPRFPAPSELKSIFGRVRINSITIYDHHHHEGEMETYPGPPSIMNPIGLGLYVQMSAIDHSCRPNASISSVGRTAVLRPLVPNLPLKNIRVSYCDPAMMRNERLDLLAEHYFFTCDCDRCRNPMEDFELLSLTCPSNNNNDKNGCDAQILPSSSSDPPTCPSCRTKVPEAYQRQAFAISHQIKLCLSQPNSEIPQNLLKSAINILHPINILRARLIQKAYDDISCESNERIKKTVQSNLRAAELLEHLVHPYSKYYPEHHYGRIELLYRPCCLGISTTTTTTTDGANGPPVKEGKLQEQYSKDLINSVRVALGEENPFCKSIVRIFSG